MTTTDSPLKQLVDAFSADFAAWLLETDVREICPLPVELQGQDVFADLVFRVTLVDGRVVMLHIEFQGRRTHRPMKWRMLDYVGRLAETYGLDVCSVVFYVGHGAGASDDGRYQVGCPGEESTISWRYRVVRLWQMKAEELLGLGRPVLLALVGQTEIDRPDEILPQVVERLRTVSDSEQQGRLLTAFVALMDDEEVLAMVEKLVKKDGLLMDTPFLRRIRGEGREEGREEGLIEGLMEGSLTACQRSVLDALVLRFDPPASVYQQVEEHLTVIDDESQLKGLFAAAIQSETMADFQARAFN